MYETDGRTVNQGQVEVGSQIGNDVPEAPQGGAIWRRNRMTALSQQRHHCSEVCPSAPPDVKAQTRHALFLAQIRGGTVVVRACPRHARAGFPASTLTLLRAP